MANSLQLLRRALRVALFTPTRDGWGLPVYLEGAPGTAKTKIVRELAHEHGMRLQLLSPGLHGDGAFGAVPVPVTDAEGRTRISYPSPSWVDRFAGDGAGILFVDELTTAPVHLQPPLLGLVNERRVGFDYLGAGVRVIAAGNPAEYAANGLDMNPAQANRFAHLQWTPPADAEWSAYITSRPFPEPGAVHAEETSTDGGAEHEIIEERIRAEWAPAYAEVSAVVATFVVRKQNVLHAMPDTSTPGASKAWPSHRTWEMAVQALTAARILRDVDAGDVLAQGLVGPGVFTEFVAFRRTVDLPPVGDVLDGSVRFTHDSNRADRTLAVLASAVALVTPTSCAQREARAVALWRLIGAIGRDEPDLVAMAARALASAPANLGANSSPAVRAAAVEAMPGLIAGDEAADAARRKVRSREAAQGRAK